VDAPEVSSSGSIAYGHINDLIPAPEIVRKNLQRAVAEKDVMEPIWRRNEKKVTYLDYII
jgi:hypothetical protein